MWQNNYEVLLQVKFPRMLFSNPLILVHICTKFHSFSVTATICSVATNDATLVQNFVHFLRKYLFLQK